MIKAKLKYYDRDTNKIIQILIDNGAEIQRMPYDKYSSYQTLTCIFNDTTHMSRVLLLLNQNVSYHGVNLIRFRKVFDFKSWLRGEK